MQYDAPAACDIFQQLRRISADLNQHSRKPRVLDGVVSTSGARKALCKVSAFVSPVNGVPFRTKSVLPASRSPFTKRSARLNGLVTGPSTKVALRCRLGGAKLGRAHRVTRIAPVGVTRAPALNEAKRSASRSKCSPDGTGCK